MNICSKNSFYFGLSQFDTSALQMQSKICPSSLLKLGLLEKLVPTDSVGTGMCLIF